MSDIFDFAAGLVRDFGPIYANPIAPCLPLYGVGSMVEVHIEDEPIQLGRVLRVTLDKKWDMYLYEIQVNPLGAMVTAWENNLVRVHLKKEETAQILHNVLKGNKNVAA